jgi:tetratricopeptide (TPR) repeat protein
MGHEASGAAFARLIELLGARLRRADLTLEELSRLDERELDVLFLTGQLLSAFGKPQAALDVFCLLALHRPLSARAWRAAGDACQALRRWRQAALAYERALDLMPGDVVAWVGRGEARLLGGRVQAGLEDLGRAVQLGAPLPACSRLVRRARAILQAHALSPALDRPPAGAALASGR